MEPTDAFENQEHPLSGICQQWLTLLKEAASRKHVLFGKYAKEAMQFYDSAHNQMWTQLYAAAQEGFLSSESFGATGFPTFRMTLNRVFEAVALFGPALYHQNPQVLVTPQHPPEFDPYSLGLDPNDPQQAQYWEQFQAGDTAKKQSLKTCAGLQQHYLNWLQYATDKKTQCRRAINEAIIKGLGVLWIEMHQPPASMAQFPKATFLSCDDLLKDPDARYREDVQWIARRCVHPVNLVERKYGFKPGELKGSMMSLKNQSTSEGAIDSNAARIDAASYDLLEYWEIYSKNGIGQRLKTSTGKNRKTGYDTEVFGEYCYLALSKDIPFPLNLPSKVLADKEAAYKAAQWPIPFWADERANNGWPCVELAFYESPDHIWPISLIKPVIGPIRFLNWVLSFLADRSAACSKTYAAVLKQFAGELKDQLVNNRGPVTLLELSEETGRNINDVITFLNVPDPSEAIWKMISEMMEVVDKGTGLTELVYGMAGTQMRSAEEANLRGKQTTIRPDEMASKTEDFLSDCTNKEIEAAGWSLDREDFVPSLGETGADVLERMVLSDFETLIRNYNYRIEANSARKPNKQNKVEQLTTLSQYILPLLQAFAEGGQIEPFNAFMKDLGEAMDMDVSDYLLQAPPQPPGQDPQAEMEMEQQKLDMQAQGQQQKLAMESESKQQDLAHKEAEHAFDMQARQQDMQMKVAEFMQDAQQRARAAQQDLAIQGAGAEQDAAIKGQQMQSTLMQALGKMKIDQNLAKSKQQAMKTQASQKPKPRSKT